MSLSHTACSRLYNQIYLASALTVQCTRSPCTIRTGRSGLQLLTRLSSYGEPGAGPHWQCQDEVFRGFHLLRSARHLSCPGKATASLMVRPCNRKSRALKGGCTVCRQASKKARGRSWKTPGVTSLQEVRDSFAMRNVSTLLHGRQWLALGDILPFP